MTLDSTSASLLQRLKQPGMKAEWDRFVDLYGPFLHDWARQLGAQPQDAADLVQEVFIVLMAKLPTFSYDNGQSFRGWLRTLVRNKWLDLVRRRHTAVGSADEAGLSGVADSQELDQKWEFEHRQYLVRRGLELIREEFEPTTWRACWELVVMGRTAAEVAAELGLSENATYIAKHRVLRRLKQELDGMLD